MPTMKPINVTWSLKPAGKGMSIIQSEPLPTDEAELRMADLDKAEAPEEEGGEDGMKIEIEGMGKPGGMPGMKEMPAFGKKPAPAMQPMGAMARPGRGMGGGAPMGKPGMPPFGGM